MAAHTPPREHVQPSQQPIEFLQRENTSPKWVLDGKGENHDKTSPFNSYIGGFRVFGCCLQPSPKLQ